MSDIVMTVIDIPNPGEWGLFITTRVAPGLPRGEGLTIRVRSGASREEVTREAMTMAKAMKAKERVAVYLHQPDLFDRQRFEADGIEVIDTPPDAIRNYLALNAMTRTR